MSARLRDMLKYSSRQSSLRTGCRTLITDALSPLLNTLPDHFFELPADERVAIVKKRMPPGPVQAIAIDLFSHGTYLEHGTSLYEAARRLGPCPLVTIQSAMPLSEIQRLEMQSALAHRYPSSFIRFQTVPGLIGGLRLFADGISTDMSWLGRLKTLVTRIQTHTYV